MDYIDIKELADIFNISTDEAFKVLRRVSTTNGVKIIHEVDGSIVIGEDYYNKILQCHYDIEAAIPDYSFVIENAQDTVPFKLGAYVYFLVSGKSIVYIGQSVTPAARIGCHLAGGTKEFDLVFSMAVDKKEMMVIEMACILRYTPEYNTSIQSAAEVFADRINVALK